MTTKGVAIGLAVLIVFGFVAMYFAAKRDTDLARDIALKTIYKPTFVTEVQHKGNGLRVVKVENVVYLAEHKYPVQLASSDKSFGLRRAILRETRDGHDLYTAAMVLPGTEIKPGMAVFVVDVEYVVNDRGFTDQFRIAIPY